jgi:hypothetical protein
MSTNTNTNKLVSTLSEINPDRLPSFYSASSNSNYASASTSNSSGGFMDFFSNFTWQTWLIIILILAFLGINIFSYLEMGTEKTKDFFAPVLKLFGYETLKTTKQIVETSATGTKAGVDIIANSATGTINAIENKASSSNNNNTYNNTNTNTNANNQVTGQQPNNASRNTQSIQDQKKMERQINELEDLQEQNLQKALDDSKSPNSGPRPDDSLSRIQASNGSGKAGWCFIGEDRGFRTCSQIGQNDQCMSGDIFPSQEICMNPNLRP